MNRLSLKREFGDAKERKPLALRGIAAHILSTMSRTPRPSDVSESTWEFLAQLDKLASHRPGRTRPSKYTTYLANRRALVAQARALESAIIEQYKGQIIEGAEKKLLLERAKILNETLNEYLRVGAYSLSKRRIRVALSPNAKAILERSPAKAVRDGTPAASKFLPSRGDVDLAVDLESLIVQIQRMVEESGDPEGFDAAGWVRNWVLEPVPALGGKRPIDLLGTEEGMAQVSNLLAQSQSGAYA